MRGVCQHQRELPIIQDAPHWLPVEACSGADDGPWRQSGVLKEPRVQLVCGLMRTKANERPRRRRRAASLKQFHSLRVGNAGEQLVWHVRTWPAMPREKAQAAPTARPKVPMRRRGADCLVVVMKRGNARGAKGAGHRRWDRGNRQREEPDDQRKAAAFKRWHEPDDAR